MGGAILNGVILGLLVSGVVLAAVSLSTPLPPRDDAPTQETAPLSDPVEAPDPDADAAAPEQEPTPATAEGAPESEAESGPDPEPGPAPRSAVTGAEAGAVTLATPDAPTGAAALPRIDTPPSAARPAPPAADPARDSAPARPSATAPSPEIAARPETPAPPSLAGAPSPLFSSTADGSAGGTPPLRLLMPQVQDTLAGVDTDPAPEPPEPAPAPDPVPEPEAETLPDAAPDAAPAPETVVADVPDVADTPDTPDETPAPESDPAPDRQAEVEPEPDPEPAAPRRLPQVAAPAMAPTLAAPSSRLPQAGLPEPEPEPEAAPAPDEPAEPTPPNALRDNAEAFEAPAGSPLMAVILIDDPEATIDVASLNGFSFPVSFAIDPMRPDAAERAAELRAAGHEVVILGAGAVPPGATPSDVEVALAVARETMPQAVALMDDPASRIQGDRPVLDATVGTLAETGHGLIAFPRGLNAAEETARRTGVPAATVFRLLDDEDQSAPVITRFLSRAAFAAAQDGTVVVVGHTRPDTVTALFSWALGGRSEGVELAPVSAVLGRLGE